MTAWRKATPYAIFILLIKQCVFAAPSDDQHHAQNMERTTEDYDEYFIEHEVSARDAKVFAARINPESFEIPAGCKTCSKHEIRYCLGPSLMNDHCCCDRRFQEMFNHIPHTCYIGKRLCQPIARDCGEYARLRACCCDRHVAFKWKKLAGISNKVEALRFSQFLISAMSATLILIMAI